MNYSVLLKINRLVHKVLKNYFFGLKLINKDFDQKLNINIDLIVYYQKVYKCLIVKER